MRRVGGRIFPISGTVSARVYHPMIAAPAVAGDFGKAIMRRSSGMANDVSETPSQFVGAALLGMRLKIGALSDVLERLKLELVVGT